MGGFLIKSKDLLFRGWPKLEGFSYYRHICRRVLRVCLVSLGFTLSIQARSLKGRRAINKEIDWSCQNSSALINLGARIACIVGSGFLGSFLQICHIVFASLLPYDYINTYKSFFSIFIVCKYLYVNFTVVCFLA